MAPAAEAGSRVDTSTPSSGLTLPSGPASRMGGMSIAVKVTACAAVDCPTASSSGSNTVTANVYTPGVNALAGRATVASEASSNAAGQAAPAGGVHAQM